MRLERGLSAPLFYAAHRLFSRGCKVVVSAPLPESPPRQRELSMNVTVKTTRDARGQAVFPALPELQVHVRNGVVEFPVHHVRGGTSTGLVLWDRLAPGDLALKEELLRHLMGLPLTGTRPGNKQITGLGRIVPTGNKVFFAELETKADGSPLLVSTLAQLAADKSAIDWSVNCGNMSAALPMWALDTGLVRRTGDGDFELDIRNTNTGVTAASRMTFANGRAEDAVIPGVDGAWPGVDLFLNDPVGAKTGKLLPTGNAVDTIEGVAVSCVDVAVPMVIARASDFGRDVQDRIETFDTDKALMDKLRAVWTQGGLRMGLKKRNGEPMTADELANSETIPKVCLVGPPKAAGNITARYFTPQAGHRSLAVSGGCCLAAATLVPGTVAYDEARNVARLRAALTEVQVGIENPAGVLDAAIEARMSTVGVEIAKAAYKRSAQILLAGHVPLYHASKGLRESLTAV
jgi:4-oxalomesaconate tautomerase